jgi:eukaryotic-like serine/threonine-protein kinase
MGPTQSEEHNVVDPELLGVWKTLQQNLSHDSVHETIIAPAKGRPTPSPPDALPVFDAQLKRDLCLGRTLGRGGMGLVRLAEQRSLRREVAVKTLQGDTADPTAASELLEEAWTTGMLEHPNIVPVHGLGVDERGAPMLVMKRIEGVAWNEAIADAEALPEHFRGDSPLESHLRILMQVCQAAHFAHSRGIVHRDLKPSNVMLGSYGEVYVVDWGLAMHLQKASTPIDRAQAISGTPAYMAPEMAAGQLEAIGPHTDVYLLGSLLHEILTGRPRHAGETILETLQAAHQSAPPQLPAEVPKALAAVVTRATARDPSARYASADVFRRAVADYLRYRESHRLYQDAYQRLERLRGCLAGAEASATSGDARARLYELFAECRFAFEHARRIWPAHEDAARGLRQATEVMAIFELDRGDEQAASLHLAELGAPSPELVDRLTELRTKRAREAAEVERLKALRHAIDVRVGARQLAWLCLLSGFIMAAIPLTLAWITGWGGNPYPSYLAAVPMIVAALGAGVWLFRRQLIANRAASSLVSALFAVLFGLQLFRMLSWELGVSITDAWALENLFLLTTTALSGLFVDKRLVIASLGFAVNTAAVVAFRAEAAIAVAIAGNLWVFWFMAWVWFRDAARHRPGHEDAKAA